MTHKDDLHHLVDELDEQAVGELLEYAHWLAADEDEPLSETELARAREGEAAIGTGDYVTLEQLHRQPDRVNIISVVSPVAGKDLCNCCEWYEAMVHTMGGPVCDYCLDGCRDADECQVRRQQCPKCLHWWTTHGVVGEDDYECTEYSLIEGGFCRCVFTEGNPVTPDTALNRPAREPSLADLLLRGDRTY